MLSMSIPRSENNGSSQSTMMFSPKPEPPPEPELVGQRMREDGTMEDMSPEEAKALAEEAEKAFKDLEDLDV